MQVDPATVARLFSLGPPMGAARPLAGRSGAGVWALATERGRWVVKVARPDGASGLTALDRAATLECAARRAGVATPRPVAPAEGTGYWVPVGRLRVRVFEYVEGTAPTVPLPGAVARWLGASVATMAALALPGPPPARTAPIDDTGLAPDLRAAVTALADLVHTARVAHPDVVLLHADINRHNILVTAGGPVLLDFDGATAEHPWHDLVHHTMLLACADLGPDDPDPATVHKVLSGYVDAGGTVGPADCAAFAGLARGLLHWLSIQVPSAAHDPVAATAVERATRAFPRIVDALPRWSTLLA